MWNSGGETFDGGYGGTADGGFMNSQNQETPGQGGERKARRTQNQCSVTLKMIRDAPEDQLVVAGKEISLVRIVGFIRAVDITSTKITYTIDDTTANMDIIKWIEGDGEESTPLMEMTYCTCVGTVKSHQGKRNIMGLSIIPVTDPNLITTHLLEVIHAPLKLEQMKKKKEAGGGMSVPGAMTGSFVDASIGGGGTGGSTGFSGMQGLKGNQQQVYQLIQACQDESGPSKQSIYSNLGGKVQPKQIDEILEFLSNEGHIYSTIDDDHYKTTDG